MKSKKALIEEITCSFEGVRLKGGLSLVQTKIIDDYGRHYSPGEFAAVPNNEIIDDWKRIPASILDGAESIAHLDSRGFRYYVPAQCSEY